MEAPKNISRNTLASWVIGALCGVVGVLSGYLWQTLGSRFDDKDTLLKERTEKIRVLELENKQLSKELRDCDNETFQILLNKYGISSGRKTMIITPNENEN